MKMTFARNSLRKFVAIVGAAALVLLMSSVSKADTCTTTSTTSCSIDLTVTNYSNGLLGTGGNYGTVTLTLDGSNIDVTVTMVSGFGLHNSDFDFNGGTGVTVSNIFWTYGGSDPGMPSFGADACGGGGHASCDGFGKFDWGFTGGTGSSSDYTQLIFTVSQTGGFTSVGQLLAGNSTGTENWFAGQIAVLGGNCTGWVGNAGSTNNSAATNPGTGSCAGNQVPEPASIALFGSGLMALARMIRRRRKAA